MQNEPLNSAEKALPRKTTIAVQVPEEASAFHGHLNHLDELVAVFNEESDRGLALFAASVLDDMLLRMLQAYVLPGEASGKLLSEARAPVGTFSARADMAAALGLITPGEYKRCSLVRKIRNEFAHLADLSISFESKKVAAYCRQFNLFAPMTAATETVADARHPNAELREMFTVAVLSLVFNWYQRADYATLNRPIPYQHPAPNTAAASSV